MDHPDWNRLCVHAIARSAVLGNVQLAPALATNSAIYFTGIFSIAAIHEHLLLANWQLFVFSLCGWVARTVLIIRPHWARTLYLLGILVWTFGLAVCVLILPSSSISTHTTTLLISAAGGGVYFWCSLDDSIIVAQNVATRDLILLVFGCLSASYVHAAQWTLTDIAQYSPAFPLVYRLFFAISAAITTLIAISEYRRIPDGNGHSRAATSLAPPDTDKAFATHLASLVIFGILRNLPTLYLFIPVYFSPYQNAILVILRWTGILLGETLFAYVIPIFNLPIATGLMLPAVLFVWGLLGVRYEITALAVLIYGYCIGTLGVWAFHRTLLEWSRQKPDPTRLNHLLYAVSSALLPGDLILNIFVAMMITSYEHVLVWPAFGLSLLLAILIVVHWVVDPSRV